MQPPPRRQQWARREWRFATFVVFCCLIYWVLTSVFDSRDRGEDAIRRQFQATGQAASSGHSSFALSASAQKTSVDRQIENLEPGRAGWGSEVVSSAISKKLKRLAHQLEADDASRQSALAEIAAKTFQGVVWRRAALQTVFDVRNCQAKRLPNDFDGFTPTNSLDAQIDCLVGTVARSVDLQCSFKVTHIQVEKQVATTGVLFQSMHTTDAAVQQANATCQCQWELEAGSPKLRGLEILDYEMILLSAGGRRLFDDVTASVLGAGSHDEVRAFEDQVLRGIGHWSERLSAIDDMSIYGHHGLAVEDVNLDGLPDLYVCDSGGLPNRLYLQTPSGALKDSSRESNADWLESTSRRLACRFGQ